MLTAPFRYAHMVVMCSRTMWDCIIHLLPNSGTYDPFGIEYTFSSSRSCDCYRYIISFIYSLEKYTNRIFLYSWPLLDFPHWITCDYIRLRLFKSDVLFFCFAKSSLKLIFRVKLWECHCYRLHLGEIKYLLLKESFRYKDAGNGTWCHMHAKERKFSVSSKLHNNLTFASVLSLNSFIFSSTLAIHLAFFLHPRLSSFLWIPFLTRFFAN